MNHYSNTNLRPHRGISPSIGSRVLIDPSSVVIGDVSIGDDSSVWPQVAIRGDMHSITIGKRTSIQDGAVLHITHAGPFNPDGFALSVGDDVAIAHHVTLHGCTIGNRVLIGLGSIIMDGASVEDEVVVGANSLVPPGKRLRSGYLYTGSPARETRALNDKEIDFFRYSANNYVKLKDEHISELENLFKDSENSP
ncbi:gamma carbonic anhydrase family protein [Halieaceae bacterium]|jgi:carbonic anhydrase/acetyltransferase-like protein (isoleucine patch superfamily)|nr:gamma carbonic anhydrase family protein [Halieaceae bacterium]